MTPQNLMEESMEDRTPFEKTVGELVPEQVWFTLRESCEIKNLNYKTSCNKTYLQPNRGIPDGKVGGKKVWRRDTILDWVVLTDSEISEN